MLISLSNNHLSLFKIVILLLWGLLIPLIEIKQYFNIIFFPQYGLRDCLYAQRFIALVFLCASFFKILKILHVPIFIELVHHFIILIIAHNLIGVIIIFRCVNLLKNLSIIHNLFFMHLYFHCAHLLYYLFAIHYLSLRNLYFHRAVLLKNLMSSHAQFFGFQLVLLHFLDFLWSHWVFIIRLLSYHFPIKELQYFFVIKQSIIFLFAIDSCFTLIPLKFLLSFPLRALFPIYGCQSL